MKNNIFKKDGKTYIFNSKCEYFNNPYGVCKDDIKKINTHLQNVRSFLSDSFVFINNDKKFSLLDLSYSANHNPEIFKAEIWNKTNALKEYAFKNGFDSPIFLTITPPSYLKPLKQIKLKNNLIKMVDNPKFCGVVDYVNESREFISNLWRKFLTQRIFKDIKKEFNQGMIYLRTYEPFIDGTLHCHIVCFLPNAYKDRFIRLFKSYFSKVKIDVKSEFKDDIGGVIAYILKYILKSFVNSKDKKLDYICYWYIKYKIRRFGTSRSLIPMFIFRKINHDERLRDLINLTEIYKKGHITLEILANTEKIINNQKLLSTDKKLVGILVYLPYYDDYFCEFVAYERARKVIIKFKNNKRIIIMEGSVIYSDLKSTKLTKLDNKTDILTFCIKEAFEDNTRSYKDEISLLL